MSSISLSEQSPSRILVVDDEARNRVLLRAYLETKYDVIEAGDGQAALRLLDHTPVDLVLLDVMMPTLNGFDTCREIKNRTHEGFLPVLLLTAMTDQDDRNAGLESGADDFLTKPVNRHELLLRVAAFLRLRTQDLEIRRRMDEMRQLQAFKDDLISLVVHDMRNPLLGVSGYLHLLHRKLEEPGYARLRPFVDQAILSSWQLCRMAEEILEVRHFEEGHMTLKPSRTSLTEVLGAAVESLRGLAAAEEILIQSSVAPDAVATLDARFIQRAVENLIANALKYSRAGDTVEIHAWILEQWVQIEVRDRGPGVPNDLKKVIFDRFGSVEAKFGAQRRGFGLGLYLVQLVAGAHGGTISVLDREGGGSVFRLLFPTHRSEMAARAGT